MGDDGIIRMWDLSTRESETIFDGSEFKIEAAEEDIKSISVGQQASRKYSSCVRGLGNILFLMWI